MWEIGYLWTLVCMCRGGFSVNEFVWLFDVEYVVVRRWAWVITGVLLLGGEKGVGACLFMYVFILKCV